MNFVYNLYTYQYQLEDAIKKKQQNWYRNRKKEPKKKKTKKCGVFCDNLHN